MGVEVYALSNAKSDRVYVLLHYHSLWVGSHVTVIESRARTKITHMSAVIA